jgi:uncharacterized protein YbaP (TraB family)
MFKLFELENDQEVAELSEAYNIVAVAEQTDAEFLDDKDYQKLEKLLDELGEGSDSFEKPELWKFAQFLNGKQDATAVWTGDHYIVWPLSAQALKARAQKILKAMTAIYDPGEGWE